MWNWIDSYEIYMHSKRELRYEFWDENTKKKDLQNPVGIKLHVPSFAAMSIINSVPQDHFLRK
jgi:hypothetical protein